MSETHPMIYLARHGETAIEPDEGVLGGGNVRKLKELPAGCRVGDIANAFVGGFRLWEEAGARKHSHRANTSLKRGDQLRSKA